MEFAAIFEAGESNWSAYIPDLPGCVATGRNKAEAERNLSEALQLHLEGMREDGEAIPTPSYLELSKVAVLA